MAFSASAARRVGKALWVQTPACECPIKPHYMAPFIHRKPRMPWVTGCPSVIKCMKTMPVEVVLRACLGKLSGSSAAEGKWFFRPRSGRVPAALPPWLDQPADPEHGSHFQPVAGPRDNCVERRHQEDADQ